MTITTETRSSENITVLQQKVVISLSESNDLWHLRFANFVILQQNVVIIGYSCSYTIGTIYDI